MTEEVWINNHKLDVNPTDIQIITNRYSDSFNLTREDSPYAFVSPHGYTVVSMVLAFDITNPESIEQLISVYTQMDQFPFVWIKSNRLVGNISGFSQSIDGYSMYLVNTLTLRHTVDAQGVIFLNVEFYYFNHTPLCHSWSFVDIQPAVGQKKSFTQKQDKTEQQYNFVSGLKPSESGLFTSYFAKEIQRRLSLAANEIKTAPNSLIFSSPQWYPKRQELIDVLNANAVITQEHKYRDAAVDIYELARYNNTNYSWSGTFDKTSLNDSGTAATKLTTEELLANRDTRETIQGYIAYINSTELSLEGLAIQDITITKSNKIAMNKMAGYTEPMLQYMGKAPSVLTIEMIADSDGLYREAEDGATNPITAPLSSSSIINALIAKIDSDSLINFKLAPFRNFKIRNPIVAMSGCKYFAFDKKIYSASSDTQGQESIMLSFVESDLNSLGLKLQSKKVTAKPYYTDFMTMVKFLKDTADRYTGSSTAAEHKAVLDRRDPRLDEQALGVPLATTNIIKQTHAPKLPALYRDNAVGIILINLNAALISTFGIAQNLGSGYKEIIAGQDPEDLSILIKNLDKLKKKNIDSAFQGTPTDTKGGFEAAVRDEVITNTQFAIEQAFYYLVYIATSERNPHISGAFVTFAQQLIKDSNNDIEQISGEGIPDLHLGEHIDTERYPSVNPQKLNPFFFLEQNVYLTPELIKEAYDVASPVVDEQTRDDKTRELLRISEYYREGLPRFRRIEDTAPQQAIDLSQPSMKPITNPVYLAQNQQDNISTIKAECAYGKMPEWLVLTMAEIESGIGKNMVNPNNPKSDFWGIMQVGHLVRNKYGIKGQSRFFWEENVAANVRTCIRWYNDELRNGLKKIAKRNQLGFVHPAWLYMLHQQGGPFASSLEKLKQGYSLNNSVYASRLLNQKVKGASTPDMIVDAFFSKFYQIAIRYVQPAQMYKEFYDWLGINVSIKVPPVTAQSEQSIKDAANIARGAVAKPTNQINVQQIAASNISSNGAVYTPIGKSGVEELASQPFENKQSRTFKGMNLTDIDIFGDDDQAQFRALRTGRYFEYGLNLAVPTAKIYIVEGNENNVLDRLYYRKRNLFEVYGVAEVKIITANEDEPVAVAVFSVLNPSSAYTDFDSIASHRLKIDPSKLNTRDEISLKGKSLRLVVGTQIHIRMGFCVDDQTEILSNRGWLKYDELSTDDIVYTLNHISGFGEWQSVQKVNIFDVKNEEMVHIDGQFHSSLTTLNHKWPVLKRYSSHRGTEREWVLSKDIQTNHKLILGAQCASLPNTQKYSNEFVELIAWFYTEGSILNKGQNRCPIIRISQCRVANPENIIRINNSINNVFGKEYEDIRDGNRWNRGVTPKWKQHDRKTRSETEFRLNSAASACVLEIAPDRVVSLDFIKALTKEQLELFIEVSLLADRNRQYNNGFIISQKNGDMLNALELACILLGYRTHMYKQNTVSKDRCGIEYQATVLCSGTRPTFGFTDYTPEQELYSGKIWCPTTQNSTWLARRKGTVYFTGNSNDPNELETVFNGEITEIDGESMLSIVAEGYGREMIMREHATDKPHGVGGTLNSSTSSIIHEVMRFDEVQHFGGRDPILSSKNPYARNILHGISVAEIDQTNADRRQDRAANAAIGGITGFGIGGLIFGAPGAVVGGTAGTVIGALKNPTTSRLGINGQTNASDSFLDGDNFLPPLHATASELFTNTYSPPIESVDPYYSLADKSLFTILFSPNRSYHTYFPIYQSTAWDVLMEMEYRHPNTRSQVLNYEQRATYFFGLKEQLYYAESPSIALINSIGSKVQAVFDNTHYANNEKYRDLKPVADFHLFTTEHNIISNDLKISSKFGTQANIRYYEDNPTKSTFKQDDFEYYVMQSDDNLLPQAIRTFDINLLGTDHKASAYRYGQVGLRKETEKMYIGKITVLGNPFIKGGDFAYINDTQRELKGIIKIKECIHTYSTEHGFITEITPALYVEEAMMTYSYLMTKMGLAFSMISEKLREKILHSYLNANQYTSPIIQLIEKSLVDVDTFNELKNVFAADKNKLDSFDKRGLQLVYFGLLTGAGFGFAAAFGSFQRAGKLIPSTQAGIRNLFIGASKLTANIFNVARATGSSAIGIIEARVAQGAAARGIGMMLVRLAVTGLAAATGMAGALIASPLFIPGMIIGIALMYTIAKVQEVEATRQPLRLFPLLHHGAPYIAGLAGWNDNTYSESLALEARKSIAATGKLVNFGKDIYKSRGSDFNILSSNLIQTRVDRIAEKYKASK